MALEGLRLAVIDTERGALTADHLERIKLCIQSLIEDLDDHEDRQPPVGAAKEAIATLAPTGCGEPNPTFGAERLDLAPAWRGATPVLCIAGRGLLDEAVSTMLAQLLENQGLASRVVPHAATARAAIGTLDVSGVAMVCISCLELFGTPSHLRYLLRRLRQRLPPDVPVLVGLWPAGRSRFCTTNGCARRWVRITTRARCMRPWRHAWRSHTRRASTSNRRV